MRQVTSIGEIIRQVSMPCNTQIGVIYMAYNNNKNGKAAPGKFMDSGKGLCSYADGTMSNASRVAPMAGPGLNADQRKANGLLQQAQKKVDSLRGKSGM
jgi:hypothetical protein